MIKALAIVITLLGVAGLILGIPGIFGNNLVQMSPWALSIIGIIFFIAGVGMLNSRKDTDEIAQDN